MTFQRFLRYSLVCCVLTLFFPYAAAQTKLITVAEWGGTALTAEMRARAKAHVPSKLTLHHAGVPFGREKDPVTHLRNLQKWSREVRGWADIPYHYIIDLDGQVFEARDVLLAGDTNTNYDPSGHALVMVLGNFEDAQPTVAQLQATVQIMADLARRFNIPAATLSGHKDQAADTACPGKNLYPYLVSGYFRREVEKLLNAQAVSVPLAQ